MSRIILQVLRESGRLMTSKEVTFQVMAERGLNVHDKRPVQLVQKRIGAALEPSGRVASWAQGPPRLAGRRSSSGSCGGCREESIS